MTIQEQEDISMAQMIEQEGTELHVHLPDPSIWPIIIAAGISLMVLGIVLNLTVVLTGLLIIAIGIGGWIRQDILVSLREQEEQH